MKRIGLADTTFSRFRMGEAAEDELERRGAEMDKHRDRDFEVQRVTVPGIKDLPVACLRLLDKCDIAMALGMVGGAEVDKVCGHEASTSIQQAMLTSRKHIIEVFVHEDEARTERELAFLFDRRTREHALNVLWMLFSPGELARRAGTGQRQGFEDAGPLRMRRSE
jgi:riboflavin synthase